MSILCDWEIRSLCYGGMVENYTEENINPASLDLRLGSHLMIEVADQKQFVKVDISNRTENNPYRLMPGEFCLAETIEVFNLPETIAGVFCLKSSRAREGYENALGAFADPGWSGSVLTLELTNLRRHWDLPLFPGMAIGQMVFHKLSSAPLRSYLSTGRYNNDLTVKASKG